MTNNPFFFGGRITETAQFVGRTAELRRIFAALETVQDGQSQHISIVGERRIGKSSLLFHVTQIYKERLSQPEKYRFVYIDLDDSRCHTLAGLIGFILQALKIAHPPNPTLDDFQTVIRKLTEKYGVMPVLCFDEFEHLTQRKEQFPDRVFEAWRSLGSNSHVVFITASATPLDELIKQGLLTSNFHNIFTLLPLGLFTEPEARTLLARSDHPVSAADAAKLLKLTGCHPAKLQLVARLFYETPSYSAILKDYTIQTEPIFGKAPSVTKRTSNALTNILRAIPGTLGRFVLEMLKNKEASEKTAIILGLVILLLMALVLFGVLNLEPWIKLLLSSRP